MEEQRLPAQRPSHQAREQFIRTIQRPGRINVPWPLAEARLKHVNSQISPAELPVSHEIWKFGSPYTLVLTKTDEMFKREATEREDALASLEWLALVPGR